MQISHPPVALFKSLLLLVLAASLSACERDMNDLEQYVAEVKARKSRAIEPIPQVKQYEAFEYVEGERGDPFVMPEPDRDSRALLASSTSGIAPDLSRNREPLEEFTLDSLRMVGTITLARNNYALVRAPDSVIHRVSPGDHMGKNFGRITTITETEISLVEIIPDGFGGWMERPATLALTEN